MKRMFLAWVLLSTACTFNDDRAYLLCELTAECAEGLFCIDGLCQTRPDGGERPPPAPDMAPPPADMAPPSVDMAPPVDMAGPPDMPLPEPEPQPAPEPAPQPEPQPAPQPEPQPAPQPEPEPAPQPEPQPAPQPEPQPAPQPEPDPVLPGYTGPECGPDGSWCIDVTADTSLFSDEPVLAIGDDPEEPLRLAAGEEDRADLLLDFDFPPPPVVFGLELVLPTGQLAEAGQLRLVVAVVRTDWDEATVAWETNLVVRAGVDAVSRMDRDGFVIAIPALVADLSADGISLRVRLRGDGDFSFAQREVPDRRPIRLRYRVP